jgi:hypothetical protein
MPILLSPGDSMKRCTRRGRLDSGLLVPQVPYGGSFHVEVHWTASRVSQSQTRLQVVGGFVPEKRMIGVAGIIKNATNEVIPLYDRQFAQPCVCCSGHQLHFGPPVIEWMAVCV